MGVGGGQLPAPEPARGALGQQGEKEGGKRLPSGLEPGREVEVAEYPEPPPPPPGAAGGCPSQGRTDR